MKICQIVLLSLLVLTVTSLKVFLMGGACTEDSPLVFQTLSKTVPSRSPQPNQCSQDWATTKCPRVGVVTSAAANEAAGNDAYTNDSTSLSYRSLFNRFGMSPKHVTVHCDNYQDDGDWKSQKGKANIAILQQADIVFFNGGDQTRHVRSWMLDDGSDSGLLEVVKERAIENEIVCAGSSAGSMIWHRQTAGDGSSFGALYFENSVGLAQKTVKDGGVNGTGFKDTRNGTHGIQYQYNAGKMPGFAMLDFFTDTHFNARGRLGRLPVFLVDLKVKIGVGIDENTSFYYENGIGQVFGWNGVTIVDISQSNIPKQSYFGISNVVGHYLTAGDSFSWINMRPSSNKTLIKSPYYSSHTDSSDILDKYEATLLETRVVDQKDLYNIGRTRRPSAFPSSTPTFQIKFYRNENTKGYYSDHKYTATNLLYDYTYSTNEEANIKSLSQQ